MCSSLYYLKKNFFKSNALYDFIRPYVLSEYELLKQDTEPINKYNTISQKLTASFFDNTSITVLRKTNFNRTINDNNGQNTVQIIFKSIQQRDEWKGLIRKAM